MQQTRKNRLSAKISALLVAVMAAGSLPLAPQSDALALNQLTWYAPQIMAEEGAGGTLVFELNRKLSEPVTVSYEIVPTGGPTDAQPDVDYAVPGLTGNTGTITIPANTLSFPIQISPINDSDHEGAELIQINITGQHAPNNPAINLVGSPLKTMFLIDADAINPPGLPYLIIDSNFKANYENAATASFTVFLSRTSTENVTFEWSSDMVGVNFPDAITDLTNSNNPSNDYTSSLPNFSFRNLVTIPAGAQSATFDLNIVDDNLDEPTEQITVGLFDIQNADSSGFFEMSYVILDNDTSLVSFASADSSDVTEGPGTQTYQYEVNLSNPSTQDLTFFVDALDTLSTAGFGTEWDLTTTSFTIPAGQTKTDVFITVNDDDEAEADETAVVRLRTSALNDFVGANGTHTFVIKSNDGYVAPVSGGSYGTAIPQSTASVGGVPAGSVVVTPAPVVPAPTPVAPAPTAPVQEATAGEVLGVQTSLVNELIAKLKFGSTSDEVNQLQVELQKLGFFPAKMKTTRYYGLVTKAAIQKYLDAKFDTMSLGELVSVLKFGQKSNAVKKLQTELKAAGFFPANSTATGFYGNLTKQAVANYLAR